MYLQSPPEQHDVKEQKTLNWHELIQIPALLFKSWPPSDQWCCLSFSVSSSVKWGQHLLWSSGSRTELGAQILPPKSCEKACARVQMMEQNKMGPSREMRDVNRTSRKRDESRMVPWESVLGMTWKDGQDADRPWEEGRFHKEEKLWRKEASCCLTLESSPPLQGPRVQPMLTISAVCSVVLLL